MLNQMPNLETPSFQRFDLKGSMRNRLVNTQGKREEELVLLDENLLKRKFSSSFVFSGINGFNIVLHHEAQSGFILVLDHWVQK